MQKIEHVMLDISVILPAPENPYLLFKNTIYWKVYDIPMIRLGFAGHVQKYQKLGSPGTKWAHNLHAGVFRHGEKDFDGAGTQKATKRLNISFLFF